MPPSLPGDDPLDSFELPPDLMSETFEHAISDDASASHERGHAVASALQRALKGSMVEYGFPGIVTAHLKSGVTARCGGPAFGWMVDIDRGSAGVVTVEVDLPDESAEPRIVAAALAKVLRRY